MQNPSDTPPKPTRRWRWLGRFMTLGFLFFLVKGLVWLGIAGAVALGIAQ